MATVYSGNNTAMQNLMNRDERLAGQTVSKNGYNVTYDSNGYATSAAKIGGGSAAYAAPSADAVLGSAVNSRTGGSSSRADYGGSGYDQKYLSNTDLQNIADIRAMAQNGQISWEQANSYANNIRSQYGYTGGADGSAYNPTGEGAGNAYAEAYQKAYGNGSYANSGADALVRQYMNLYDSRQSAYAQALAAQQAAQEAAVQKAVNSLESQKNDTNTAYSDYYRQAYIDRMNAQKNLNQRLAAQGISGGASESAMLGISTAYSDALRQAEQSRIGALSDLDRAISDARLTGDIESANAAASAIKEQTDRQADVLQNLISRYDTLAARQQAYDREDAATNRSYAAAMVNNMLENGIMPDEESLAAAGYTASMAQTLLEAINAQKARDLADYSAKYGDYSGLEGLGIDTSYLTAQQKAQLANLTASRSGGSYGGAASAAGENIYETLANAGIKDYGSAYAWLRSNGYSTIDANRYANYFANTYLTAEPTSDATKPIDTGGMDASTFNQEARAIMSYLGQGRDAQAQNRLAAIWNSLSEDQQRQLTDALVKNGYAS